MVLPHIRWRHSNGHLTGQSYGTILCDLERHQVIDLLDDREATRLQTWLEAHPGIKVICRDRAGQYAEGARVGAPNASQVADRFHLLMNLTDTVKLVAERQRTQLQVNVWGTRAFEWLIRVHGYWNTR